MKATAVRRFTATIGGRRFDCDAGDALESDVKTIEQLEAIGLVTTKQTKGAKPGKAAKDD